MAGPDPGTAYVSVQPLSAAITGKMDIVIHVKTMKNIQATTYGIIFIIYIHVPLQYIVTSVRLVPIIIIAMLEKQ